MILVQVKNIDSAYSGKHPNLCENFYIKRRMTAKNVSGLQLNVYKFGTQHKTSLKTRGDFNGSASLNNPVINHFLVCNFKSLHIFKNAADKI